MPTDGLLSSHGSAMPMTPVSLGLRSNPSKHGKAAGNARLINCFAEEIGEEGKTQWVITATPGLSNFGGSLSLGADNGVRDMLEADGALYAVAGRQVYQSLPSGAATLIGGVPTDGPAYMRRNRRVPTQIGIVSDGYYAVVDSNVLTEIQDTDLPPPSGLAYLDGYGILPTTRGRYFLTGLDDFSTIDALDVGVAESNPDPIVRAHELGREVYLFGSQSTEAHQNTGAADFPFERSQTIEIGCAAADSVCAVDSPSGKALMFVAHDHTVRLMPGYTPQVVSTGEIENLVRLMAEAGTIGTLKATTWSWGGRFFYALSSSTWTRVYDGKTGFWHERKSYLSDRWRVAKVVPFNGKLIAGDVDTGQLYQMLDETHTEGSDPHVMQVIFPPVHAFPNGGVVNALHLDMISGVGLNTTTSHNLDPVALLDWSKDGGDTWSTPREIPLHRLGQTARRIQPIRRLGRFGQKGLTFRLTLSPAVKKVILSASIDVEQLEAA
jgi:hypothetical protein